MLPIPVAGLPPMRLLLISIAIALVFTGTAFAQPSHKAEGPPQDPTKTLPKSYKVEFENDAVRVVRVHYDAKAKLPEHAHPGGITVYLYFNPSSGVLFSH